MNDIELDEILKLLEEEEEKRKKAPLTSKDKRENKDVLKFIRNNKIAPGENKVPNYLIYYHWIHWARRHWLRIWGKQEFFRTFKKYFEPKRSGHQRYYMINDALDQSDEMYEKAKKYDKKWQKPRKKSKGKN